MARSKVADNRTELAQAQKPDLFGELKESVEDLRALILWERRKWC